MGIEIDRTEFSAKDFARFERRLHENLAALKILLDRPGFGEGPGSVGAELELYVIDRDGRPLHRNTEIYARAGDARLSLELNRFNLECNLSPVPAAGRPFSRIESEMSTELRRLNALAASYDGQVVPIGILPTLRRSDFGPHAMTPRLRYEALCKGLQRIRGDRFTIRISGPDPLRLTATDVTLEGANTSLQIHYRVPSREFARLFNAVQLLTPVVLAISCNSPLLMGHRLWHETRIPLFKLSVDGRNRDSRALHLPARVDFGSGWVREGIYELFSAAVHLHRPLLPLISRENALRQVHRGVVPSLWELRLHQGTLWPWNRPIYDHLDGGHLRIEMRALPAGPSATDMMANAAFALGIAEGLKADIDELLPAIPFATALHNFYRAAEHGIETDLFWPADTTGELKYRPAVEIAASLLPVARRGLRAMGVDAAEARHYLAVIERRLERRANGATWQLRQLTRLLKRGSRRQALRLLVQHYAKLSLDNLAVADWPDIA
jgi:gamma-glutamyl:cysteine ligase YbdK (ATP-grasp superfamily)